jgi:hypothetical protein
MAAVASIIVLCNMLFVYNVDLPVFAFVCVCVTGFRCCRQLVLCSRGCTVVAGCIVFVCLDAQE